MQICFQVIEGAIGMEAEALDVGAVLLGDVALLVMAPLVIYAALKMIWEEQVGHLTCILMAESVFSLKRLRRTLPQKTRQIVL